MGGTTGETRGLLPASSDGGGPRLRASDVGVTVAPHEKKTRWHVTAAGLFAPAAAAAVLLLVAVFVVAPNRTHVITFGQRGAADVSGQFANLGDDADDFFKTQFASPGSSLAVADNVGGLGAKSHHGSGAKETHDIDATETHTHHGKTTQTVVSKTATSAKEESAGRYGKPAETPPTVAPSTEPLDVDVDDEFALPAFPSDFETDADEAVLPPAATGTVPATTETETGEAPTVTGEAGKQSKDVDSDFATRKPKILIAVISWQNGAEEVAAMQDTWLGALEETNEWMDADYRVFVGQSSNADLGGTHSLARVQEHKDRRGFGGDDPLSFLNGHPDVGIVSGFGARLGSQYRDVGAFDTAGDIDQLSKELQDAVDAFEKESGMHRAYSSSSLGENSKTLVDSKTTRRYDTKHAFTSRLKDALAKGTKDLVGDRDEELGTSKTAAVKSTVTADDSSEGPELTAGTESRETAATTKEKETSLRMSNLDTQLENALRVEQNTKDSFQKKRDEKTVTLAVGDSYEDLPQKVLGAIQYANDNGYDYVYKVDTDVFVLPSVFLRFVRTQVADKKIDWMGSENKMYPVQYVDPKLAESLLKSDPTKTIPENLIAKKSIDENTTPSGFKCGIARQWHFGKCTDRTLNTTPYAGVNSISVDGGHGYLLSKEAMWAVSDWIWKRADDLQRHKRIDIYEDQLISHILVKQGFLPVDYSGVSPFAVKGVTKEMADDACVLASDEKVGAEVGGRLRAMRKFRFESGANLYETGSGWNPSTMDAKMLPTSLLRVGIQPYVWRDAMLPKWEYFRDSESLEKARDDGSYVPHTLPLGFELVPAYSPDDVTDVAEDLETPDDELLRKATKKSKSSKKNRSRVSSENGSPDSEKQGDDARLDADEPDASTAGKSETAPESPEKSAPNSARPGAWITVEELSDDPFQEPDWLGDDSALVKAQVQEMLEAKRKERAAKGDTTENDAAVEKRDAEEMRAFEIAEAEHARLEKVQQAKDAKKLEEHKSTRDAKKVEEHKARKASSKQSKVSHVKVSHAKLNSRKNESRKGPVADDEYDGVFDDEEYDKKK